MPVETTLEVFDTSKITTPKASVLYIGRERSGKTHAACSWPSPLVVCFALNPETVLKFDLPVLFPGVRGEQTEPTITQQLDAWRYEVLPAIKSRRLSALVGRPVESVVVDDLTQLALMYKLKLLGCSTEAIPRGGTGKLDFDQWNLYMMWLRSDITALVGATRPDLKGERDSYNVICTVHERDTQNDAGAVVKISPAVDGQMKDVLASMFGTIFWCDSEKTRDKQGRTLGMDYFVHTISPDGLRRAGSGLSGGRFGQLPPKCEGTYPELAKHWGLNSEEQS